jgi:hypothetical protein
VAPAQGAVAGIGLEYVLQVSDDEGATYHESSRLQFGTTSATISLIPSYPSPRPLLSGNAYIIRVAARNSNTAGLGAFTSLRVFMLDAPQQVTNISVEALSSSSALLAWQAPLITRNTIPAPAPSVQVVRYDMQVSLYKRIPQFVALGGILQSMTSNSAPVARATLTAALTAAGQDPAVSCCPAHLFITCLALSLHASLVTSLNTLLVVCLATVVTMHLVSTI